MGRRQTDRRAECKCWPGKSFQSLALVCLAVDLQTGKLRMISDYDPHDIVTVAKEIIAIDNRNFNWFGKMDDWHETSPHPNLISGWCQVGEFSPDISNYTNSKCVLWPGCFQQGGTSTPQKVLSCNCGTCSITQVIVGRTWLESAGSAVELADCSDLRSGMALVGGFKHGWMIFHFILKGCIGMSSFPFFRTPFFKMVTAPPTRLLLTIINH